MYENSETGETSYEMPEVLSFALTIQKGEEAEEDKKFGLVDKVFETRPEDEKPGEDKGSGGAPE